MGRNSSIRFRKSTMLYIAVSGVLTMSLTGCQGMNGALTSVNNGLAQVNSDMANTSQGMILNAGAQVSPEMAQAASSMVMQSAHTAGSGSLQAAVQQAMPAIQTFLHAWMSGLDCRGTEMYALPGDYWCMAPGWPANAPKNMALNVQSVGDWNVITANSFSFVTNFCSSFSQTCVSVSSTYTNMGDGWKIQGIH